MLNWALGAVWCVEKGLGAEIIALSRKGFVGSTLTVRAHMGVH